MFVFQIRNVPDEPHRTPKVRATKAGMTLTHYLLSEIEQVAEKPTMSEWLERVKKQGAGRVGRAGDSGMLTTRAIQASWP